MQNQLPLSLRDKEMRRPMPQMPMTPQNLPQGAISPMRNAMASHELSAPGVGAIEGVGGTPIGGNVDMIARANMAEQKELGLKNFDKDQVSEAIAILQRYKNGKAALEERIKEENLWWRRRHTEAYKNGNRIPAGSQLFNSVENKIADIYDNMPEASFLARSQDDEETAELLTSVMPAILEQNDIEGAYLAETREKVTCGTGVYAVTWDQEKQNGLGDVNLRSVSPLNLYWEPGVSDIQESPHLFYVDLVPNEVLESQYPQLINKLKSTSLVVTEYIYDDTVDNTKRSAVIDYYYKRKDGTRTVLHYAKICGDEVLYATENDPEYATRGWYDHGKYPFVFDVMFPLPGSPCGFGYISVGKEQQYQIDRLGNAIVRNAIIASTRRKYIRKDANINKDELMDLDNEVVEVGGSRDVRESVMTIDEPSLSGNYITILNNLEGVLKETTANRDFAQGGTTGGVTSGTALTALIEAGNKQSRAIIRGSYDAFKKVVTLVFELYRQFGDVERFYRIKGVDGSTEYASFSNAAIAPQPVTVGGVEIGTKEPIFDIVVKAHKQSPFARATQNTMMQEFYGMGFFNPENATPALACLDGMEFDGKDTLCRKIEENGTLLQENQQLKAKLVELASQLDPYMGAQLAQSFGMEPAPNPVAPSGSGALQQPDVMRNVTDPRLERSAETVAASTAVR